MSRVSLGNFTRSSRLRSAVVSASLFVAIGGCKSDLPTVGGAEFLASSDAGARYARKPKPGSTLGCTSLAPLYGTPDPAAPGYLVVFKAGTDAVATTERLSAKYGFVPREVYTAALSGFSAELTDSALAGVRCEPEVNFVEHNAVIQAD